MKITEGFDERHSQLYFVLLSLVSFASALMLVAAIFMPDKGRVIDRDGVIIYSIISLIVSTSGYLLLKKFKRSFFLVGASGVAFSLALHDFGAPSVIVMLLGGGAAILGVGSLVFGDAVDKQVSSED